MRNLHNRKFLNILVVIILLGLIIYLLNGKINLISTSKLSPSSAQFSTPIILWWTSIIPNYHRQRNCGIHNCIFTTNRNLLTTNKKAFVFYGSDLNYTDLPLPRLSNHIWALLHEESPKNIPYIQYKEVLKHFNITGTFSRYSDFPLTTLYLENLDILITQKYMIPIGEKNNLKIKHKLAPIAFIQSICDTMSGRNEYVSELMKYIKIDSYGKCLNNKKLPESLTTDYLQKINSDELYKFLAKYKFIISYENGVCDDYITEKFWRSLIIGSVPIYFGAPTIRDWMPNKNSVILIEDFDSPKDLANYINYLDSNDVEYNKLLDHKYSQIQPISNKLLINSVVNRDYLDDGSLFENFECFVCGNLFKSDIEIKMANQKHYNCGNGIITLPRMETNMNNNLWYTILKYSKCEAIVIDYFLNINKNFTMKQFNSKISEYVNMGICDF